MQLQLISPRILIQMSLADWIVQRAADRDTIENKTEEREGIIMHSYASPPRSPALC